MSSTSSQNSHNIRIRYG